MLELKLAKAEDLKASAGLLVKAHAPSDANPNDVPRFYLPNLEECLGVVAFGKDPSRIIVLGVEPRTGLARAAYELPPLNTFQGSLELRRGWLASEPALMGFGSVLLTTLMPVFEQVAFESGKPLSHLPETYFSGPTRFFMKHGYALVGEHDNSLASFYYLKRAFSPLHRILSKNKSQIVRAILAIKPVELDAPAMPEYARRPITVAQPAAATSF